VPDGHHVSTPSLGTFGGIAEGRRFPAVFFVIRNIRNAKYFFMLRCKTIIAAMQTNPLSLASGIHKLTPDHEADPVRATKKGTKMSKTASIGLLPSSTLVGRLLASIDRLLTASSRIAIRNGDQPRFGL
jgi:hypothetical protein